VKGRREGRRVAHITGVTQPKREWFDSTPPLIDPLFAASAPARAAGNAVTFEPGARTAWHAHPLGQTLIVTFGRGWVQREGGPRPAPRFRLPTFGLAKGTNTTCEQQ